MRRQSWAMVLLPWGAAAFLFKPRYRLLPEDPLMSVLGRIRAIAGLVMTVGIAIYYGAFSDFALEPFLNSLLLTGLLAVPSMLLCMGVVVALAGRGGRGAAVRQLRWPALTLGVFVTVMAALLLFNAGGASRLDRYDDHIPLNGMVYGGIVSLWFLVFAFRSIYLISQYWFNAVDGHPYLQPLMAIWMAWVLAINTLVFQNDGDAGGVPSALGTALPVLAATVTTALAAAEAARVREALQPVPNYWPDPSHP
ncbi:hypothetical protein [Virgisporangium ochraceum]|nr:hypothetical protein [Virgisporangium ochraceum]